MGKLPTFFCHGHPARALSSADLLGATSVTEDATEVLDDAMACFAKLTERLTAESLVVSG
jgi:hypothetical protein